MGTANDLTKEDVIRAIVELKAGIKTRWGRSKRFLLIHDGEEYAPKEVLGLAICLATGVDEWSLKEFSGGSPTNDILRHLGFEIIERS